MKREDKPIRYEKHALQRMRQRGITEKQVSETVRNPTRREPARRDGAEKLMKSFSKTKRIVVIAEEWARFIRVVSAYKG